MTRKVMCFSLGVLTGLASVKMCSCLLSKKTSTLDSLSKLEKTLSDATTSSFDKMGEAIKDKVDDLLSYVEDIDFKTLKGQTLSMMKMLKEKVQAIATMF